MWSNSSAVRARANVFGSFGITRRAPSPTGSRSRRLSDRADRQPTSDVTIRVVSNPTRTSRTGRHPELRWSSSRFRRTGVSPGAQSHRHLLASVGSRELLERAADHLVRALNDARVDGSDTQVVRAGARSAQQHPGPAQDHGREVRTTPVCFERESDHAAGQRNEKQSMGNVVLRRDRGAAGGLRRFSRGTDRDSIERPHQDEIDAINEQIMPASICRRPR